MGKKDLLFYIKKVQKRVFLREAVGVFSRYLLVSLCVGVAVNLLALVIPFYAAWRISVGAVFVLLFLGICHGLFRFPGKKRTARLLDEKGLSERVTTALEGLEEDSEIARLQRQDTLRRLEAFSIKAGFPLKLDFKRILAFVCLLGVFAVTALLPSPAKEEALRRQELSRQIKVQTRRAEELKRVAEELLSSDTKEAKEALKREIGLSIQELSLAKTEQELQKAEDRLEKKLEKALGNRGFLEKLSPKASSLLESYLPGKVKEQRELAKQEAAKEKQTAGSGEGKEQGQGKEQSEGKEQGQGEGQSEGKEQGQGQGSSPEGKKKGKDGTGYDYGSKQGIEKEEKENLSIPEQITIPGRKLGKDENLTGGGEEGSSTYQKGSQSEGLRGEKVDYESVLGEYSRAAYGALSEGKIPAGMETVVKNYFDGLNE